MSDNFRMLWQYSIFLKETIITGYAVAQLVEALRYKSKGRGFDSR